MSFSHANNVRKLFVTRLTAKSVADSGHTLHSNCNHLYLPFPFTFRYICNTHISERQMMETTLMECKPANV